MKPLDFVAVYMLVFPSFRSRVSRLQGALENETKFEITSQNPPRNITT